MLSRRVRLFVLAAALLAAVGMRRLKGETLESQHWPVLSRNQVQALIDTISGETALDHVRYLSQYWRWAPSKGFHHVAEYVVNQASSYGLSDAHIERFIADKTKPYLGAPIYRPSWDPLAAELWVVEPVREKITSFADIPMCIGPYSRNTDATAELVDVGSGAAAKDYEGKEVRGKIVLGTAALGTLQQMAIFERGAAGVLSAWTPDFQTSRGRLDYPDQVSWGNSAIPESRTGQPSTFGFMLSERQRYELLELLRTQKKVMMHATVRAEMEDPGYLEVATATIPGREFPDQEIVFTGHLEHPKPAANDNGSGSAAFLEIARVLQALVRSGQMPPLKRTVRFLWVEEERSTRAYVDRHPEVAKKVFADINMDIVGDDQEKTKGILYFWRSPASHPGFVSDVMQDFFEVVRNIDNDRMPAEPIEQILAPTGQRRPFVGDVQRYRRPADHSTLISVGVPSVYFADWPDQFHHTQFDTPDKVDPTQLKRVVFMGAAAAAAMANATPADAIPLASHILGRGRTRLGEDLDKALSMLDRATAEVLAENYKEARNIVHQGYLRERGEMGSVRFLAGGDTAALAYIKRQDETLAESETQSMKHVQLFYEAQAPRLGVKPEPPKSTAAELRAEKRIPAWKRPEYAGWGYAGVIENLKPEVRRKVRLITYNKWPLAGGFGVFNFNTFETLNFINGKRSVKEIRDAVSAEYDPLPLDIVEELADAMAAAGLVEIRAP